MVVEWKVIVMDIAHNFPRLEVDWDKYNKYTFEIKDNQVAKLPPIIKACKKCVTTNQRPRTEFDEEGVCNACRYAEKKFFGGLDWKKREQELRLLLDKHRSKDGSFDVIVPSSGGKDSSIVSHQLKYKYGMHPLTVTWAPFVYTPIGFQNYFNLIQSGFDGLVAWPNGLLHRKLARVAFELKGDPWDPFTYGQKAYAFQMAVRFKIPLIFYGENGEIEYGGSFKNVNKPFESPEDWDELYFKGLGFDYLLKEGIKMGIFSEKELAENKFELYRPPSFDEIKKLNIQMHWWSYYKLWVPQENFYYSAKNTGFKPNSERTEGTYTKFASIDDQLDQFHWYLAFIKFGWGRATREASSDIRCGHITREEGISLVKRYDSEFPKKAFKIFLRYLDISEEHFWKVIDRFRSPQVWKQDKKENVWVLKRSIYGENINVDHEGELKRNKEDQQDEG